MIDQDKSPATNQAIHVGIYGCTKAGKTRFLFQLLNNWKAQDRLLPQSEQALAFLAQVRAEIEKHDGSMPTVATTEGIRVKVRRDGNESPLELIFRDLRGELLSGELDQIASLARDGAIPTQVRQCRAFLFFFDPTSSENPADIDTHYQREFKRATVFIEYVLKVRENRHLPIIFVLTHLDRWENDADIRAKADRWGGEVHAKLVELYDSALGRFHPKSIVDRSRTAFSVSSVGKTPEADRQLEKVVEQLNELVVDSAGHRRRLRKSGRYALLAGAVFLALLAIVPLLISLMGGSPPPPHGGDDRTKVSEMPEQEILANLDELDRMLKAHPRGTQLPSVEEAKKLNHHLRWLEQRLELNSGGTIGLTEKSQQRMQSALDSLAKIVQERTEIKTYAPSVLTPILAGYLEDLPDLTSTSPSLAAAQTRYWQLQRALVVEQVAGILKRRHEVASSPTDALGEVVSRLRAIEQEVGRCKVFGPQVRQDLVQEIQTAVTFCEDRKNSKTYPATFRIVAASYASDNKVDLAWRSITLQSPGRPSDDDGYGLEPIQKSDTELSFNSKQTAYQITLGLGAPVTFGLSVHDSATGAWRRLHEFDLTTEQGPLAPLGLPFLRSDQAEVTKLLQWEGMELKLEFSGFPRVPTLLWDTAKSAMERQP
jgi:hypothetical protein